MLQTIISLGNILDNALITKIALCKQDGIITVRYNMRLTDNYTGMLISDANTWRCQMQQTTIVKVIARMLSKTYVLVYLHKVLNKLLTSRTCITLCNLPNETVCNITVSMNFFNIENMSIEMTCGNAFLAQNVWYHLLLRI